jgi:hypothetical protein
MPSSDAQRLRNLILLIQEDIASLPDSEIERIHALSMHLTRLMNDQAHYRARGQL